MDFLHLSTKGLERLATSRCFYMPNFSSLISIVLDVQWFKKLLERGGLSAPSAQSDGGKKIRNLEHLFEPLTDRWQPFLFVLLFYYNTAVLCSFLHWDQTSLCISLVRCISIVRGREQQWNDKEVVPNSSSWWYVSWRTTVFPDGRRVYLPDKGSMLVPLVPTTHVSIRDAYHEDVVKWYPN